MDLFLATFFLILLLFLCTVFQGAVQAQLSYGYYDNSCPNAEQIARTTLRSSIIGDPTAPAALLRLVFHDCQVNGCDASILLTPGGGVSDELSAPANLGIRRLNLVDQVKSALEAACPQTVSCADVIALAGRDAVAIAGGPDFKIPLGRLDGFSASASAAQELLPSPTISIDNFLSLFGRMGMSKEESVAIIGAHTLGVSHCTNFMNRLYPVPDPNMGLLFSASLRARCPPIGPIDQIAFANLDSTSTSFDNQYFRDVQQGRGILTIDTSIGTDPATSDIVEAFAKDFNSFSTAFSSAYVKLTSQGILHGNEGEIRINCATTN